MTKAKRTILAVAIAILYLLFIAYAIETFYHSPKYEEYCNANAPYIELTNQTICEESGGVWTLYEKSIPPEENPSGKNLTGWCDFNYKCNAEFQKVTEKYNRNIFFVTLIIGVLTFIIAILLQLESVSTGFMAGGVLIVLYGTIRFWGDLSDVWRTIMLGLALGILVWLGYKKLK